MKSVKKTLLLAAFVTATSGVAEAQVPPDIAKQLVAIGRAVCIPQTSQIYRPLQPDSLYSGVSVARDVSFGPDPQNVVDIFTAEKGGDSRPVLIFVSGGPGNRRPNGDVFYDNILLWAAKNGMVGVNVQRRPGRTWDDPAKDIGVAVHWVNQNIARYKGNPGRVFLWAHSAGNIPVGGYIGHPDFYGPQGAGVKGVVFMSPGAFNILPVTPPTVPGNVPCGQPSGEAAAAPAGPGRGNGKAGGAAAKEEPDAATQLARSNLPGLTNSKLPFFLSVAELDPPNIVAFAETLRDQLCKAGHCPTYVVFKDHSHISEVMSADTEDTSVTGPVLKWMKAGM